MHRKISLNIKFTHLIGEVDNFNNGEEYQRVIIISTFGSLLVFVVAVNLPVRQ